MTQEHTARAGALATDRESEDDDTLLIISISDARSDDEDEAFIRWDYNMEPLTVADMNEEYGYDPEQPFVSAVFTSKLNESCPGWENQDLDFVKEAVEDGPITAYKYPINRLQTVRQQF